MIFTSIFNFNPKGLLLQLDYHKLCGVKANPTLSTSFLESFWVSYLTSRVQQRRKIFLCSVGESLILMFYCSCRTGNLLLKLVPGLSHWSAQACCSSCGWFSTLISQDLPYFVSHIGLPHTVVFQRTL